jgi:hypothetical protein
MEQSVLHASRFGEGLSLACSHWVGTLIQRERVAKSCRPTPGQSRARVQAQSHEGSSLDLCCMERLERTPRPRPRRPTADQQWHG